MFAFNEREFLNRRGNVLLVKKLIVSFMLSECKNWTVEIGEIGKIGTADF